MPAAAATARPSELGIEDWQRLRLLLDRALQPVERFDGFEWRDQFQTAAVRYQLNFVSYALAMVQANHLPALQGCLLEAQLRLRAKQSDHRIWRYWQAESLWGHLRRGADPIARDNIMYSGFVATQVALANAASGGRMFDHGPTFDLAAPCGARFVYSQDALVAHLARQYRTAPFGLLACEPNWIYPLCNLITATALKAHDAQRGTDHWRATAGDFREALAGGFTGRNGHLVPFVSSLCGLAPPALGGAVMQAFPCLFLNALFPDLASLHWARFRESLAGRPWRRAFWPIDVGNYGFSRASSLAASAAAAVEMGDAELAALLLQRLDEACPDILAAGARHRPRASLWAHALEACARYGRTDGLRRVTEGKFPNRGPTIAQAPYPDCFVASAHGDGDVLDAVVMPEGQPVRVDLDLEDLVPGRSYRCAAGSEVAFTADAAGRARIGLQLAGRTVLRLVPVS